MNSHQRLEDLISYVLENGFTLNDAVTVEMRYGRPIEFTFRDLVNDFNRCNDRLQGSLLSEFNVNSFDFKKGQKITDKKKIKDNFKTMYLRIVAEGIGGTKWRI